MFSDNKTVESMVCTLLLEKYNQFSNGNTLPIQGKID